MMNHRSFTEKLVLEIPELASLFEEHKSENEELLPHVFFGDLTRYVSSLHKDSLKGNREAEKTLKKILSAMEDGMASESNEIEELVAVSFLENLDWDDSDFSKLESLLGPRLRKELNNLKGGKS